MNKKLLLCFLLPFWLPEQRTKRPDRGYQEAAAIILALALSRQVRQARQLQASLAAALHAKQTAFNLC